MASEWYCFQCKEQMENVRTQMEYLEVERPAEAIRCPRCGENYLEERIVVEVINKVEQALEDK